ncbi:P-loop containing nucleoside triphosphate hydrolase protein [Xylaria acuta]|nr:P-loop containing nucleoside triphosphate hydrolase protein [Xylaria acuta]
MKKAPVQEETRRSIIFSEFQKLRKEIRVMCRIRPSTPNDGTLPSYETSEGKFHSKPAGLEIISKKGALRDDDAGRGQDKTLSLRPRVRAPTRRTQTCGSRSASLCNPLSTGRQVTIFCYGQQTATGKTYTMSNSSHEIDDNGGRDPHARGDHATGEDPHLRGGPQTAGKGVGPCRCAGCCYEAYLREIRLLLPNRVVKAKTLDPAAPPWWHGTSATPSTGPSIPSPTSTTCSRAPWRSRTSAATASNPSSSRSPLRPVPRVRGQVAHDAERQQGGGGSLCLVDLAGSRGILTRRARSPPDRNDQGIPSGRRRSAAEDARAWVLMFVMINLGADSLAETKATLESGKEVT